MPRLSVTIITKNEAHHIADALSTVAWADEILVLDSGSQDATCEIARQHASRVMTVAWGGYAAQKNRAASLATHDWILSLDADERVSPGLADELRDLMASEPGCRGYRIPRLAYHLGRWIRSTDWYPDHQLRLYHRGSGRWNDRPVHESVSVRGPVGTLRHDLLHYPYRDLSDHLDTIDRYTSLAARHLHDQGRRATLADLAAHPAWAFLRNYCLRLGIRDGIPGLLISSMNAYYVFLKFAKLWEIRQRQRSA